MDKFVSNHKMSKKARREVAKAQRNTWGAISPITRRIESKKLYKRKKVRLERDDTYQTEPFTFAAFITIDFCFGA